jgi:hypothetical protein
LRCGTLVSGETIGVATGVQAMADRGLELESVAPRPVTPLLDFDDWDLDPELRSFRNARAASKLAQLPPEPASPCYRFDASQSFPAAWAQHDANMYEMTHAPAMTMQYAPEAERRDTAKRGSWLAWAILSLGLMAFTCGGVLLAWSYAVGRTDLWNLGIPVTVIGQIGLLVGLVLQLERIWQNNRYAVEKLDEVDEHLADIRHSHSLLRVNHSSAAQAFYAHMAEGANPSMLLADLKGQLDLLAVRLSQRP